MFDFSTEQKVIDINGTKCGGRVGEYPTILIGSIFYEGDRTVLDESTGEFDKKAAEGHINNVDRLSEETGIPHIYDVVGTENSIIKYIDFVADMTSQPFLVDGVGANTNVIGLTHVEEVGLSKRAVFNSISHTTKDEELEALKNTSIDTAILLGLNTTNLYSSGRAEILEGTPEKPGIFDTARSCGISQFLIDTATLDVPSIGNSTKAVYILKDKFGYPAGSAPHNGVQLWERAKSEYPKELFKYLDSSVNVVVQMSGGDFILYGPVKSAERVFRITAMVDAILASMAREDRIKIHRPHPLYQIF